MTPKRPSILALAVGAFACAALLAACSGRSATRQSGAGDTQSAGTSGHQGIKFNVTIDFTGLKPIQGSFVDDDHAGDGSCEAYAKENLPIVGWQGPQPPVGHLVTVAGQKLDFAMAVPRDAFHGPGTYTPKNGVFGVTVGDDTFSGGGPTSVTVNADGSGSATFTDIQGLTKYGRESGTIRWTCSPM
jgi:hypothetical protein